MNREMIAIRNLSKYYGFGANRIDALKNINLDVKIGEIYGIIGRSGAGKSTLLRCVNRLETPSEGTVFVNKLNLTMMSDPDLRLARKQIGMIFQHFNLLESRTVFENISLPLELIDLPKAEIKSRVNKLLHLTELKRHQKHYPNQLSGGQKQRVAIARALATSPKVLLCDEATSALDPRSTQAILDLLKSINTELNISIMLITHEMDVIKEICHSVAVLHEGEIIEQGPVLDVFTDPQTQVAKEFIKTSTRMDIPKSLRKILKPKFEENDTRLIRISYRGRATSQPIIGYLISHFKLTINIIQANIETIQEETVGVLVVEVSGTEHDFQQGLIFLNNNQLHIEIIGYVHRAATGFA